MNLLVIRLSAMGDVALTVPVLNAVLQKYPDVTITLLTRSPFTSFFQKIERLECITADVKNRHKGMGGLYLLYKEIKKKQKPDLVIDLHDVLRSWILCTYFKMDGVSYFRIDKGRKGKKALTRKKNKKFVQLKHTAIRYLDVFEHAGLPAQLSKESYGFKSAIIPNAFLQQNHLLPKSKTWIGLAPFAKHEGKRWPLNKMQQVIHALYKKGFQIFLFGGGKEELAAFESIKQQFPSVIIPGRKLSIPEELGIMTQLDAMVSMDSANMHLAAISAIPVVSIWGATHPFAGFGPLNDNKKYIVQIPNKELSCRPCSVYGNKPCFRRDHACMIWITPEMVLENIERALKDEIR